jgi:hypothetical protein
MLGPSPLSFASRSRRSCAHTQPCVVTSCTPHNCRLAPSVHGGTGHGATLRPLKGGGGYGLPASARRTPEQGLSVSPCWVLCRSIPTAPEVQLLERHASRAPKEKKEKFVSDHASFRTQLCSNFGTPGGCAYEDRCEAPPSSHLRPLRGGVSLQRSVTVPLCGCPLRTDGGAPTANADPYKPN